MLCQENNCIHATKLLYKSMTLDAYLSGVGMSAYAFAKVIEVDTSTVTRLRNGECMPTIETLRKIERATDGKVGMVDFLNGE